MRKRECVDEIFKKWAEYFLRVRINNIHFLSLANKWMKNSPASSRTGEWGKRNKFDVIKNYDQEQLSQRTWPNVAEANISFAELLSLSFHSVFCTDWLVHSVETTTVVLYETCKKIHPEEFNYSNFFHKKKKRERTHNNSEISRKSTCIMENELNIKSD